MSERKVINKWHPPDYDPIAESKRKKPKKQSTGTQKSRMMMPFLMRCLQCNEYIPAHRSFNARKTDLGEQYLGIKIYRFLISCPQCNNTISLKTSPQTAEMVPDGGGVRNFEPKKRQKRTTEVNDDETEEELFQRLEREDEENKRYQELLEKRKLNPFWQKELKGELGLEQRIGQHVHQQQAEDELERAMERMENYQLNAAKLTEKATAKTVLNDTNDETYEMPEITKLVTIKRKKTTQPRSPATDASDQGQLPKKEDESETKVSPGASGIIMGYDSDSD